MTRHGLDYIKHLKRHPEFDFRIRGNNPRNAKAGVSHTGSRCQTSDPNGDKGIDETKDTKLRGMHNPHLFTEQSEVQ